MDEVQLAPGTTVRDALIMMTHALAVTEGGAAASDARRLLMFAAGCTALDLIREPARVLTAPEAGTLSATLRRRARGEPVSRIIGRRGFYGREFLITPATLDPRPESETLIDAALDLARERWRDGGGLEILDIGTGSGCLLLTLLAELPGARGTGVDVSAQALAVAAANAEQLGLSRRATWVHGRNGAGLTSRFPLIISNPPYIPSAGIPNLARDVRDHDPAIALDGGADGLAIYRELASEVWRLAAPGWALFEFGEGQAAEVIRILAAAAPPGITVDTKTYCDMADKQRCVAIGTQY